VDQRFFGAAEPPVTRGEAIERLIPYIERHLAAGGKLHTVTRHVLGLYHGEPGARIFRRLLSGPDLRAGSGLEPLERALAAVTRSGAEPHARAAA